MRSIENRPLKNRPGLFGALRQRLAPLLVATTLLTGTAAEARTDVCYTGGTTLSNFKLNGTATLNGIDLLVTPDAGTQLGSAMFIPQFSPTSDIHVQMKLKITTTIQPGADGMAFVMHRAPGGITALGLSGGGIGYGGITPSIAIEMDTFTNAPGDLNDNHIGITTNGNTALHLATYNPTFVMRTVGTPFNVWIDYTASATRFDVFVSQSDTKPATAQLTYVLNVATFFGNMPFYMGFTGSTGGSQSQHEILSLIASDGTATPCCTTNADCAGNPQGTLCDPEKHVCGQCLPTNTTACPAATPRCDTGTANNTCAAPCMSNFGSGMAGACTSAATPFCVTAGANAGTCVTCNGNFNSGAMFACPAGAPTCSSDGQCFIPCTRDNRGTGGVACPTAAKPFCAVANGTCTTCTKDSDCTSGVHAGPYCDTATGACTQTCSRDAQCATDEPVCNSEGDCIACTSDSDCTTGTHAGPSCNTSTGACEGCTTDSQCAANQYCNHPADAAGSCVPKIANDQPLPQATDCTTANGARICQSGICSPSGSCVECTTYTQCADGMACGSDNHCINGALSGGGFSCATAPRSADAQSPALAVSALALTLALAASLRRRRAPN